MAKTPSGNSQKKPGSARRNAAAGGPPASYSSVVKELSDLKDQLGKIQDASGDANGPLSEIEMERLADALNAIEAAQLIFVCGQFLSPYRR